MADDPVDPHLPARLRALSFVVQGEERIRRGWFRAITRWLDSIRAAILSPHREAGQLPDPGQVGSGESWEDLVDEEVMPAVRQQASIPWAAITRGSRDDFAQDVDMMDYLDGARNRMVGIPDEVYRQISHIIQLGIDEGEDIDTIAENVSVVLRANGSQQWPNRAVTVARTETIGATNAGAFYGAAEAARERGDESAQKQWISTVGDGRTRETHVVSDKQRVGLFEPFIVGGFPLMFPGDPEGPPQEVIACRCSILEVVAGEELDWTDRQFLTTDPWADDDEYQDDSYRIGD